MMALGSSVLGRFAACFVLVFLATLSSGWAKEMKVTVTDTDSLELLDKASVIATFGSRQLPAVTQSDGKCTLKFPEIKIITRLSIKVSLRGYIPSIMEWPLSGGSLEELPDEYTFYLEKGGPIGGKITDEAGEPISDVEVHIFARMERGERERTEAWDKSVLTNSDGIWRYENLPTEMKKIRLRLKHEDYITDKYFDYGSGGSRSIADLFAQTDLIQLVQSLTIIGLVQDSKNQPVKGAKLAMGLTQGWPGNATSTKSNDQGEFKFRSAQVGETTFSAQAEGFAPDIILKPIDKDHKKVIFALFPGHYFKAKVVDDTGTPVAGADVSLVEWRDGVVPDFHATTGEDGRIQWNSAPGSEFKVNVVADGFAPLPSHPVQVAKEEVIIPLKGLLRFFGSVVDDESGEKIAHFSVTEGLDFSGMNSGQSHVSWQEHTKRDFDGGSFDFKTMNIRGGMDQNGKPITYLHAIRIEAEGYLPFESPAAREQDGPQNLEVRLKKGKSIIYFVKSPDGKPVQDAEAGLALPRQYVSIQNGKLQTSSETPKSKSNAEGKIVFSAQSDPGIIVVVHDSGWAQVATTILGDAPSDIILKPWARIEGRLLREGNPLGNSDISLRFSDLDMPYYDGKSARIDWNGDLKSDSNGEFSDNRIREGDWIVSHQVVVTRTDSRMGRTFHEGGSIWSARAEAKSGETVKVELDEPQVRQVIGKFTIPSGNPEFSFALFRPQLQSHQLVNLSLIKKRTKDELIAYMKSPEGREEMRKQSLPRTVPVEVTADGNFSAREVPLGEYVLHASVEKRNAQGNTVGYDQAIQHRFSVKAADGDEKDVPVDLGELELTMTRPLLPGDPTPSVNLVGLDGTKFNLTDYKNKNLVLVLWHPMIDGSESMKDLSLLNEVWSDRKSDSAFAMLGLTPHIEPENAKAFLGDSGLQWPKCTFENRVEGTAHLGSPTLFTILLFDSSGHLLKSGIPLKEAVAEIEKAFPAPPKK